MRSKWVLEDFSVPLDASHWQSCPETIRICNYKIPECPSKRWQKRFVKPLWLPLMEGSLLCFQKIAFICLACNWHTKDDKLWGIRQMCFWKKSWINLNFCDRDYRRNAKKKFTRYILLFALGSCCINSWEGTICSSACWDEEPRRYC